MLEDILRRFQLNKPGEQAYRINTTVLPYDRNMGANGAVMGQKFGDMIGLIPSEQPAPMTLNQTNLPTPTFATPSAPQYGTTESAVSGNPTESSAPLTKDGIDMKGAFGGLGDIASGIQGKKVDYKFKQAPTLSDDNAQRFQVGQQMFQEVLNKRRPKGLI